MLQSTVMYKRYKTILFFFIFIVNVLTEKCVSSFKMCTVKITVSDELFKPLNTVPMYLELYFSKSVNYILIIIIINYILI